MTRLINWFRNHRPALDNWLKLIPTITLLLVFLTNSSVSTADTAQQVRAFTRSLEFDFPAWMLSGILNKIGEASLGIEKLFSPEQQRQVVFDYLDLVNQARDLEYKIELVYADPATSDPQKASEKLRQDLEENKRAQERLQPLAEAVIQNQVTQVLKETGLTVGGQPLPPVLYHATPLPMALIISPRAVIRQIADISLEPDLTLDDITRLEETVDQKLDVSSLVVDIGGVGVYPTMVYESSNLEWLTEVVAHEWIHNYLTLRPLGVNYLSSPELRIMNETTASIAGKEIGRAVMERFYPERLPPPPKEPAASAESTEKPSQPVFDFRKEMHTTRVVTDQLLAEGKIEEAEKYMEQRRQVFWDNGYLIRKLNQAYFAFYGAYADQPGGAAAGGDPVGGAIRDLRAKSDSLAAFVKQISWMWSFDQLLEAVNEQDGTISPN